MKQELVQHINVVEEENVVEFDVRDILPLGLTLAVSGIAIAYSLQVMGDVEADMDSGSAEANATNDAITGVAKLPAKFGLIATVIVAAIVLGVVVRYLGGFAAR